LLRKTFKTNPRPLHKKKKNERKKEKVIK